MTETHPAFLFYSGSSWSIDATLHDTAGAALDLTDADVAWRLYSSQGVVAFEASIGNGVTILDPPTDGKCRIDVTAAQTTAIPAGSYRDEIVVTSVDGFVCTQAVGLITVAKPGSISPAPPDYGDPCATLGRLQQARIGLLTGQQQARVKVENFEVWYTAASIDQLERAIAQYETACAKASGRPPRRFAIGSTMRRTY